MAIGYKARKRLAILTLVLGVPAYIVLAISLIALLERPALWIELLIYVGLGVLWIFPLKWVFMGIGQPDPEQDHKA